MKQGVWNGGLSPHQPFHSSSVQGPCCGPNLPRPMISAPIPRPQVSAMASSAVMALAAGCVPRQIRARANQLFIRSWACPKGVAKVGPSPVANPSSETTMLWMRTFDIMTPGGLIRRCGFGDRVGHGMVRVDTDEHEARHREVPSQDAMTI